MAAHKKTSLFDIVGFILIIFNAIIFLYFIIKLHQIEKITRDTQAQAQQLIQKFENQ